MTKKGNVYVVCAMDTEGPIDNPQKPDILNNWDRVRELIQKISSPEFRHQYQDSAGNGLVFSWFILTLTGFKTNPFKRPMEYHEVFDFYKNNFQENFQEFQDSFDWHYHQPAPSGIGNEWSRDWTASSEYFNILARTLIERDYFPTCFRAGGRIQDDDQSNWLEEWIPFDYSNNSGQVNWDNIESDGKRLRDICDWSRAPEDWQAYHPSEKDYQNRGEQKRWLFRCPDLDSPVHILSDAEIEKAFLAAKSGKDSVLAFFEHDRRMNVIDKIAKACERIHTIGSKHQEINWYYKNAKAAAQLSLEISPAPGPQFDLSLSTDSRLIIASDKDLFARVPFAALKSSSKIQDIPLYVLGQNKWISAPIDSNTLEQVAIAASSKSADVGISSYSFQNESKEFIKRKTQAI